MNKINRRKSKQKINSMTDRWKQKMKIIVEEQHIRKRLERIRKLKMIILVLTLLTKPTAMNAWSELSQNPCLTVAKDELQKPELAFAPIRHEAYFLMERELTGYNPAFTPNVVSFSPENEPLIRYRNWVQRFDPETCKWNKLDFTNSIQSAFPDWNRDAPVDEEPSWMIELTSRAADDRIVFDDDGDAYMHVASRLWQGVDRSLLLHSTNGGETWDVYGLPPEYRFARLEYKNSHNDRKRPPLLILWDRNHSKLALVAPEKSSVDGTLHIPEPIQFALHAFAPSAQAGGSNVSVTSGNYSYIVWASRLPGNVEIGGGTPTFIIRYNHASRTLSKPVYLGSGDANNPNNQGHRHAIPAIAMDSKNTLHVVLGSHHRRLKHTHALKSHSIFKGWTTPKPIGAPDSSDISVDPTCINACDLYTYVSLVIGMDDTLHLVSRWARNQQGVGNYYMQLAYHRNAINADWEARKDMVVPFRPSYTNWYQQLSIDRLGRLFLYYIYYANQFEPLLAAELGRKWPDYEIFEGIFIPVNPDRLDTEKSVTSNAKRQDPVILISEDNGDSWRIATSADFIGIECNYSTMIPKDPGGPARFYSSLRPGVRR